MKARDTPGRSIKTTHTVFAIIEIIQRLEGAGITEIANQLDLAKSTVHGHIVTLEQNEYVLKRDGVYYIGTKFLDHGMHAAHRRDVYHAAKSSLEEVAEETGECAWLSIEEHGYVIPIRKERGERGVQTRRWMGRRAEMHTHAPGKAILANLPDERINEIIEDQGLDRETSESITDQDDLLEELEQIRDQGYAISDREALSQLRSVAAPIILEGEVVGAISVSGPANRIAGELLNETYPSTVQGGANAIELRLTNMRHRET